LQLIVGVFRYECFQVSLANGGHKVGKLYKRSSDANNFGLSCKFARSLDNPPNISDILVV